MKKTYTLSAVIIMIIGSFLFSCKKDPVDSSNISPGNKPPIANAGLDQTTVLPQDSVVLDGTASKDPGGSIVQYEWKGISGPVRYTILKPSAVQTVVNSLVVGVYSFELKVTDNEGLTAKDTVQVTVCPAGVSPAYAQVTPIGTLSEARAPSVAAAGSKIVFAGGPDRYDNNSGWSNTRPSAAVDIYDLDTHSWTRAQLSAARQQMGVVSCGNKIFFAGGAFHEIYFTDGAVFDNVDIYDVSTNTWSVAHLSEARTAVTAAVLGNKVFFAGGSTDSFRGSRRIDIYDVSTNTWSVAELSDPKYDLDAVVDGNQIYFVGGGDDFSYSSNIDSYDISTNHWSTSKLQSPYVAIKNVVVENTRYWIYFGGDQSIIKNMETNERINFDMTYPCAVFSRSSEIFFVTQVLPSFESFWNSILIYNTKTREWYRRPVNQPISASAAIISADNKVYAGGGNAGNRVFTDKVYTISW